MNGISIPIHAAPSVLEEGITEMLNFISKAQTISDWGDLQARTLFESIPMWRKEPFIRVRRWEEKFKLSKVKATTRSVNAFKQYLRIEDFSVLGGSDVSAE
jgi:hypothetical protein